MRSPAARIAAAVVHVLPHQPQQRKIQRQATLHFGRIQSWKYPLKVATVIGCCAPRRPGGLVSLDVGGSAVIDART
jgi:hypothetical protein